MKTIEKQIEHGMALAFFASAYADQADECGKLLSGEIMDQLPDVIDKAAKHAAKTLHFGLLHANRTKSGYLLKLYDLYRVAELLHSSVGNKVDRDLTPELFGHCCAMQAMRNVF